MREKILVAGNFRQTITVVRSLGRAGYHVVVGRQDVKAFTEWSRYTAEVWPYASENREAFFDQLEHYLKAQERKPLLVFPVGEFSLERLARVEQRFKGLATFVMPDPGTIFRCLDKRAIFSLTEELQIPLPPTEGQMSRAVWRQKAKAFGYPVIVKRNNSFMGVLGEKARKLAT
ncbi:MAG: hypothetical protein HY074_16685, partial [Deltaproteobacteria bacterium]|nr:hypothetical protein [Deltaproteobacteria bacterium]